MLDHSAYPDILDAIFAYADLCALLALRAASRSFRDRVDAVLAQHLVFRDNSISPVHSKGWHPAFICLASQVPLGHLDHFLDRLQLVAAHTLTLDIDARPDFTAYPALVSGDLRFPALRTLRLRPTSPEYHLNALPLSQSADTVIVRTPWPPHPSLGFPISEPASLVSSVRRLVYNVDASQPFFPLLLQRALTTNELEELVVIFLSPASPIIDGRDRALLRTMITTALEAAAPDPDLDERRPVRTTFVNIAQMPADCIPIPSSEFDDYVTVDVDGVLAPGFGMRLPPLDFRTWKRDEPNGFHPLERYVRATLGPELGMELYDRVQFCTMAEYRASVGPEAFAAQVEWTER
ncbi:hypothetical protein CC85DRAFT_300187 [Cutaneotrichosporon oleaginosum]|uniref:F-box domain-containing protein n=1 Tax=Cutaneotrichosporon oleaginosum TaxID=879819 RepID=A0A0J0XU62_9TREE|nr:uncharacterized protein CC85DRAFT_300187 [Cutaneotrichosporon oleaginosum]KLT44636.1 hypothetical protein CC85DRAFT_300187 [Cutaneotrichosporon oleaginosum]TXT07623.1 hypothetical protein COLE_04547 [Cutaneotrichosporon oleaginosum]